MTEEIVTLRVPRRVADALDEKAKEKNEYKHSRAPWADLSRDILEEAAEASA